MGRDPPVPRRTRDLSLTVAIVGRPNTGKSTLFNRLVGKRLAIVHDTPGVTRDWKEAPARLGGLTFRAIDTAGLEEAFDDSLEAGMRRQTEHALARADVALLVVDARAGITPLDRHFAQWLRKQHLPVIVLANKAESRAGEAGVLDAFSLGLGEPIALSAEHGHGIGELADALIELEERLATARQPGEARHDAAGEGAPPAEPGAVGGLDTGLRRGDASASDEEDDDAPVPDDVELDVPALEPDEDPDQPIRLAVVGRPNVGKSTLINALLNEERLLTSPIAGTTRDAIAIDWSWRDRRVRLVDTAGLRRRARIVETLERLSVQDTLRAIRLAHICVLVLDADAVLDKQELTIARHVVEEGRALVLAVNKWDAARDRAFALRRLRDRLEASLPQVRGVPAVTISALRRQGLDRLLDQVLATYDIWNRRIGTGRLNRFLEGATQAHPTPLVDGRPNRIRYMTQIKARPPTFALWCTRPDALPETYLRYLAQGLRETFDLPGVPLRFLPRRTRNPYAEGEGQD